MLVWGLRHTSCMCAAANVDRTCEQEAEYMWPQEWGYPFLRSLNRRESLITVIVEKLLEFFLFVEVLCSPGIGEDLSVRS